MPLGELPFVVVEFSDVLVGLHTLPAEFPHLAGEDCPALRPPNGAAMIASPALKWGDLP